MAIPFVEQRVAVHDHRQIVFRIHVNQDVSILLRSIDSLILGREMLQVDTCGEGRIATVVEIDFSGVYNLDSRLSAEFFVVPVGGTHALLSVGSAQVVELALEDFIARVPTALNELGLWCILPDAV